MGFSIELHFDNQCDKAVLALRDSLADAGLVSPLSYEYRPHITLGYFDGRPTTECLDAFEQLALELKVIPISLSHLGIFPGPSSVLFIAPAPSTELIDQQRLVYEKIKSIALPIGNYCESKNWVPHVTLTDNLDPAKLGPAVKLLNTSGHLNLPLNAVAERLVIAEEQPIAIRSLSIVLPRLEGLAAEVKLPPRQMPGLSP